MSHPRGRVAVAVPSLALALLLGGCSATDDEPRREPAAPDAVGTLAPVRPDLDLALSDPVEDSVYPQVGSADVDALHYGLDLAWDPTARRLEGTTTITFRAAREGDRFRLDLARPLRVDEVTLDGAPARFTHRGKDLVVRGDMVTDERHELVVAYAGRAGPVPAPITRGDFSTVGFTVTERGEVWTMQEPYGAYSWYPVNDQPADKALYDFRVTVPAPWTGIANGRLLSTTTEDGSTTTAWQLDEPAASYLVTLAIGDYEHASNRSASGLTVDYWVPRGLPTALADLRVAARGIDWIESRLGDYPFSTAGIVVTDSMSGMETQTLVTLGNNEYVRSSDVIVHELAHQWYGDQVTPADWSDVWLSEGMTMLLQGMWEAERTGQELAAITDRWRRSDQQLRDQYGPPGDYDPAQFGGSNVYYPPALMWDALRQRLGDERFFEIARSWLADHDNTSVTRDALFAHWEAESGLELSAFFDAWLMGATTPPASFRG